MSFKNADDMLSSFPEEILYHILSLMPTKYAVRTSVLSKSWRYRWTQVTNLEFHYTHVSCGFTSFVDRVLNLCNTSQVQLFRLHSPKVTISKSSVSNWINEAVVRLKVCELDIKVMRMELPLSMLTSKTLTKLRLDMDACNMREEFPCQVNLPCVKTLDMTLYNNHFAVNAFKLINGCSILESLSLKVIGYQKDRQDYTFNIPTLKQLKLIFQNKAVKKVILHVPNLEYLFVGKILSSVYVMEDVSSLVEASVAFHEIKSPYHHYLWIIVLKGLSRVQSLSLQNVIPIDFRLPCFSNMKHLKLTNSWKSGPVFRYLESSPELKHVYIEKLEASPWIEPKLVPTCMLTNLTTIKFSISKWQQCDTPFLEYILGNAKVLKSVTIIPEHSSNVEEERLLRAELLKFPRASKCCEMHFHGN